MTEKQLQAAVVELCKVYGIAYYHTYNSERSVPGWPDLALCGAHGFITRELKGEYGKVSIEQDHWGWMLRQAGVSWDVWRPDDLRSGRVQRELLNIRLMRRRDTVNVGFRLYREIRDFAPPDWTSGEYLVALMIADDANDETRKSWIDNAELCYRTRLRESSVRANLAKLAARGWEFRVSHGNDKNGRPVFATRGHATDYRVPDMFKGASPVAALTPDDSKGASPVAASGNRKALAETRKALAEPPKGAIRLAPLSSISSTSTSTEELPVITPSVEVPPLSTGPNLQVQVEVEGEPMTALEAAAWRAIQNGRQL